MITTSISITKEMTSPHISTIKSSKQGRKYVQFFSGGKGQEQEESKTEQVRIYPKSCAKAMF